MPPTDRSISSGKPLAVFVGAITAELETTRNAVVDAVLRAQCRPHERLDDADVYVGVVGQHYDPVTEHDYNLAVERKIPRLVYLAVDDAANAIDHQLTAFKNRLRAENACEPFASLGELRALVTQGLLEFRDGRLTGTDVPPGEPLVVSVVPRPPEFYTAPAYLLQGSRFVGRRAELAALDSWARSDDPLLVVEAIGGMGKSALTWEWAHRSAENAIRGLAGRVWWSFYERGTSMKTFLRHALAYVTRRTPNNFSKWNTADLTDELVTELRRQPFLLVLDGFERVLTAYHRSDKAQIRDDRVPTDARECTNPRDGEALRHLLDCAPSRVLVSSRLMPAALEVRGQPLRGVRHLVLAGLESSDALEMAESAGVRGNANAILEFADQFDRHPLLLRIACGAVADYGPRPGDFDLWAADPAAGGSLKLADLAARHRYTHLLEYAFRSLNPKSLQLLSRIAVLSDTADYATIAVLNPFVPPPPPPAPPAPKSLFESQYWQELNHRIQTEYNPKRREALTAERDEIAEQHQKYRREYLRSLEAVRAYPKSTEYRTGMAEFHAALVDLEERGLLQWDRNVNTYDMHPVVRAYAFDLLETGERTKAFSTIGDYFASRHGENAYEATELAHLRNSVEIVRAFTGAGRGFDAARFLKGRLSETLLFNVGAHHTLIELLTPLLGTMSDGRLLLSEERDRSYTMNNLAIALNYVGRLAEAKALYTEAARLDIRAGDLFNLETGIRSLARCMQRANELYPAERLLALCEGVAQSKNDQQGITGGVLDRLALAATLGKHEVAEELYATFRSRPSLPLHLYRAGSAEYHLAVARFHTGRLTEHDLAVGEQLATTGRGIQNQHLFAALRAEWELTRKNPTAALEAIERAVPIVRRTGESAPEYLGLRANALAQLGRHSEALDAIADCDRDWDGHLPRYPLHAAEACVTLGNEEAAGEHLKRAYRCAWADGPPYSHRYYLERCREWMKHLHLPEMRLSEFHGIKAEPSSFEEEFREIAAWSKVRRAE